ncbi:hypothetical protein CI102_7883 [Trichoderma harzianum]|uniref:C2H2-type domain-containing protein n=1 Tax=Trichoderma harzianum CBS 226.95 TaxID=983964 RepID=A0A2T3ZXC5_TRIHA|nr:hypothetical protein M431DRAFT_512907 [Trichoderma harzianum CBS 226.95]PKK45647.1 hypothetical protein CI102_7883 [Trichoderma harzianum]PTB49464.1 hypothetical protein M431DRAFT_512907 [Trichoderma harzianum CBS 226.95]
MSRSDTVDPSLPLDQTNEQPIELKTSVGYMLFEPVMLLLALTQAVRDMAVPRPREENINIQDPRQLFYTFVNKLSHVCDRRRGELGKTVTSFVVLKKQSDPDKAHYIFAANRQTDSDLQSTARYVTTLLRMVGQAPEGRENQDAARHSLLYRVLCFNRHRITFYLKELRKQAALCVEKCEAERTDDNELVAEGLTEILASPNDGLDKYDPEPDYIHLCETTIKQLIKIEQTIVGELIEERALENRMVGYTSMECWAKLLHAIRRILAYQQSVQFFLMAKDKWPNLFEDFTVSFISSSRPVSKPGRQKSNSAESIAGRMKSTPNEIETLRTFVRNLQTFNLDDRIKEEFGKSSFNPIVHAEVLLLNWISKQGPVTPSRFFNGWKYIGCSKPTCKLCSYYFEEHQSGVEHRPSHGNLYPSWRLPDVFPHQGEEGLSERKRMMESMKDRVRQDAFDIVSERSFPSSKRADSNTDTARMTLLPVGTLRRPPTEIDDLASIMGQVDIG